MTELNNYEKYILSSAALNAKLPNKGTSGFIIDDNNPNIDSDDDLTFGAGAPFSTVTSIDGTETFPSSNAGSKQGSTVFGLLGAHLRGLDGVPLFETLFKGGVWKDASSGITSLVGARTDYDSFFNTIKGLPDVETGTHSTLPGLNNTSFFPPNGIGIWEMQTALYDAFAYYTGINSNSTNSTSPLLDFASIPGLVSDLGAISDLSDGSVNPATNAAFQQEELNGPFTNLLNDQQFVEQLFKQTFTAFLRTYNWPQNVPGDNYGAALWTGWLRFISARTVIDEDAGAQFTQGVSHAVDYRALYDAFVPGGNNQDYKERLVAVYREAIQRDGYFLPSHNLGDFVDEIQKASSFNSGRISPVAGTGSARVQVLMRLFRLLVEMIDILQKVTAVQAERLRFYAAYQKEYTSLIGQVPIMDNDKIGLGTVIIGGQSDGKTVDRPFKDPGDIANVLNQLQAKTSGWTDKLRAFRSTLGDEAKQHQTAVNQSNEIVNQQAQLGTSLLQQMSTILTTIFK